jgi:serine phosphatase RsbU (regulator of sigma subunit)
LPSGRTPLLQYPFPIDLLDVVRYVFVFALLLFLVRRFSLARQEEARLSTEMEAARNVQSLLVPAIAPHTPGFAVQNVYLPASEVGGDFFQVRQGDDGSLLIVTGDVSGKGLKAAMTVSTIMGALRGCLERHPARVLTHLNNVLHGHVSGFVTCCVALISSDGLITIANAGHLSPYINGDEMPIAAGLPLGMIAESSYDELQFRVAPGDRLTFVSDGVVEARSKSGELFGFERTAAVATCSAESIAEAAQRFGQEDDITVISVTFTAALEPVAM